MSRPILSFWVFGITVLTILALTAWAQVWAQAIDADPCQQTCYERHDSCVSLCGDGGDPIECEATCSDALEDCLRECR